MKKAMEMATRLWLRLLAMFAMTFGAITRMGRAVFAKVCTGRGQCSTETTEIKRSAVAGMILFGIAGAGMGASGLISAYPVVSTEAGATVAVGWGPYWLLWTIIWAATGAAVGAGAAYLARLWSKPRGAATALLVVGALGGAFTASTWGYAVARERVVEVRAQPASAKPIIPGNGASLSVTNGPVRLTGSVARDFNLTVLSFMLGSGALVGILAARGLSVSNRRNETPDQPFGQPGAYTA